MMKLLPTLLFTCAVLCEARVISFSATSTVSQADADKQAMSGIAMQIRADVSSTHQVQKSETSETGKDSRLEKNYRENILVNSNVVLNGIELKHEKSGENSWKTVAVFDTEKATAAERKKLRQIREEAAELDSLIASRLSSGHYGKAVRAFGELQTLQLSHQRLWADISVFEAPDDSYSFPANLRSLEDRISKSLAKLKLSLVKSPSKADNGKWEPVTVSVSGEDGPAEGVEVVAEQNKKILATEKSDANGRVSFSFDNVEASRGEHTVLFRIHQPGFGGENPSWRRSVPYTSDAKICPYEFQCEGESFTCSTVESVLSQAGFENGGKIPLQVRILSMEKKEFDGGPKKIIRTTLSVEFRGKNVLYSKTVKGTGSSDMAAAANAIHKISSAEIQKQLSPLCSEK